jgi:hypothetical protein
MFSSIETPSRLEGDAPSEGNAPGSIVTACVMPVYVARQLDRKAGELKAEVASALKKGELHPELREVLRVVDPQSEPSIAFGQITQGLYQRMVGASTLPLRDTEVSLAQEPSANAAYLPLGRRHFIFNSGLCVGPRAVDSIDGFASVLAHELAHREFRERYGVKGKSSKFEEAFADGYPIFTWLWDAGFNPKAALKWAEAHQKSWRAQSQTECLRDILDEHPSAPLSLALAKACLAWLELERGDCGDVFTPIDSIRTETGGKSYSLTEACREAKLESFVDERLRLLGFSKGENVAKDLDIVAQTLASLSHLNSARVEDIAAALSSLTIDMSAETHQAGITAVTEVIYSWALRGETKHAEVIYDRLALSCSETPQRSRPILGRLVLLEQEISAFIAAQTPEEIASSAARLHRAIEAEPLCAIQCLKPGYDKLIVQNDFLDERWFSRFKANEPGSVVPWQKHFTTLVESQNPQVKHEIFAALIALGVRDYRMLAHLSDPDLLSYFSMQLPVVVSEMKWDVNSGQARLHELRLDPNGTLTEGKHRESLEWEHRAIKSVVERHGNSPEVFKFQALFDYANAMRLIVLAQITREKQVLSSQAVALPLLETFPAEVARLNRYFIADSFQAQSEIVAACRQLMKDNPDKAGEILRRFFLDDKGRGFHAFGEYSGGSDLGFDSESRILGLQRSPFLQFICKEGGLFLPAQEQLHLVAVSGLADNLQYAKIGKRKQELASTIKSLWPVIEKLLGSERVMPQSFAELQVLQEDLKPYGSDAKAVCTIFYLNQFEISLPPLSELESIVDSIRELASWGSKFELESLDLALIRRVKEKLPARFKLDPDLSLAIREIRSIGRYDLLAASEFHGSLGSVLDRVMQQGGRLEENLRELVSVGLIREPGLRKRLFGEYAAAVHQRMGVDDGSDDYATRIAPLISDLQSTVPISMRTELFGVLAEKLETQRVVSFAFRDALDPFLEIATRSKVAQEVLLDAAFNTLTKSSDGRELLIEFIFSSGTSSDIDLFLEQAIASIDDSESPSFKSDIYGEWIQRGGDSYYQLKADTAESRKMLHHWRDSMRLAYSNFWEATLPLRATMCANLFFPEQELSAQRYLEVFERVLKIAIPDDVQNRSGLLTWTRAYIQGKDRYKQPFYLAALATATLDTANNPEAESKVGSVLASLAEQMGPAELKFAQAADGHPGVPEDCRPDPVRVKTRADVPYRWKFFETLEKQLSQQEMGLFRHIGPITNAGSIYITAQATAVDGRIGALSLERLYTANRADSGFRGLERMIDNHGGSDFERRIAKEMVDEGRRIVRDELDVSQLPEKVRNLKKLYSGAVVTVDGTEYRSDFVDLYAHGEHFRFTQWVDGQHTVEVLNAADGSPDEKRKLAVALVAIELTAILKGLPFCNDRHGGNSKQLPGNHTLHFDPGGAMVQAPSQKDMQQLAEAIFSALNGAASPSQVVASYLDHLKERYRTTEELPDFLKRTQKAFSGLGEYFRLMTEEDTVNVLVAALPHAHPALRYYAMKNFSSLSSSASPLVSGLMRALTQPSKAVTVRLQL